MQTSRSLLLLAVLAGLAGCTKKPESPPTPKTASPAPATAIGAPTVAAPESAHDDGIAWRRGDVDAAFAEAKTARKPVFLYWGATWCPPCNQMKATLFKRRDFIERTQSFVPVYVDGDAPAAQKLGTRFAVSGYPTMVLFRADGTEVTRLPGEADPERYLQVLALGMNSARPVRDTLRTALGDGRGLKADDWKMLAWYAWDTDDQQLVPTAQVGSTLQALATRCPADLADTRTRLMLRSAAAAGDEPARGAKPAAAPSIDRAAALAQLDKVLASPQSSRDAFDLLTGAMPEMVRATTRPGTPERRRTIDAADRALARLATDTGLSNTDRLGATIARVQLATIDAKAAEAGGRAEPVVLPEALRETVRSEVSRADRESTDPYERQTVVNAAASLLTSAGMIDDSDALLRAELSRSHSPYYFMLDLASNARKRGDKAAAIDWYAKAYDAAKGPATRLQWGSTYVAALVDLAPDDASRIAQVATQVLGEVEPVPESFDGRNRRSLSRIATRVAGWHGHAAAATRVAEASRKLCDRVPAGAPERMRCGELLQVGSPMAKPGQAGAA